MSINEEMLDDLANSDTSIEDLKNIDPVPPVDGGGPALNIHTPSATGTPVYQSPLTDDLKAKLLSPSTQLVSIREGVEEVESMEKIQKDIADASAIGVSDARIIMESFKGFEKQFKLGGFTTIPSSINLREVKEYVNKTFKLRKEEFNSKYNFFIGGTITDAEDALKTYQEVYGDEVMEVLEGMRQRHKEVFGDHKLGVAKQAIYLEGYGDANAATTPIHILLEHPKLVEGFEAIAPQYANFLKVVQSFDEFLKADSLISSFMTCVQENYTPQDMIDASTRVNTYNKVYSPLDLVATLASPNALSMIQKLENMATKSIQTLKDLDANTDIDRTSVAAMSQFVLTNGRIFDEASDYAHHYSEIIDLVRRVTPFANAFMAFFALEK